MLPCQLKSRRLRFLSSSSNLPDNNAERNNKYIASPQYENENINGANSGNITSDLEVTKEDKENKVKERKPDANSGNIINRCNELEVTKEDKENKVQKRKPDFCVFCETEVFNFARHVTRNHSTEIDVQKILSKQKKTKERRQLLATLKKRGNFLKNYNTKNCFKPRKKANLPDSKFLPCVHCLGFYSSKQLRRHRKNCSENPQKLKSTVRDSNAKLSMHIKVDAQLRELVFGRMQADRVSLVAQHDTLICAFGARYLKLHRENHMVNVVSRKMRELAKVLIEIKKTEPSIKNMLAALNPKYFDLFVTATKILAKFNPHTEKFESPTFAMNIATSLKQCCDIAINLALKKSVYFEGENTEGDLKNMIFLFKTNWKYEISSQAGNDLNSKTWNRVTIIPLATDLKMLKNYLNKRAEEAACNLIKENFDKSAYNTLFGNNLLPIDIAEQKKAWRVAKNEISCLQ
ncbi:hypothetical protein NQ314_001819 [Rhamnusium bicolor]|uniref:Uncharacterized protein n=1 Tax=Rhamnusium bicolor TaxID=1586634 RepID=A0AAV8ZT99_9CUCU|nr:hypothetical protein NQ314_001819 [Rhamnusium bicolor]